ncbi:MAG: TrkA family potassium uptake protein [Anaerobutyricum sp.]|nr:TrkA family potassium uptake protein [Eubacterium sp.]MDY6047266.1 TrkA family potassium uptake protein [Anaerobutyricum sp.]
MVKSYAVLGLGSFGKSVARSFMELGIEVLAVDRNKIIVNEIASEVTYAVQMDVTNEDALKSIGVEKMDGVIVAIGENLEASVMATLLVKELGVPYVVAKAETEMQKKILEKIGADKVVFPEKEMGVRLAKNIAGNFLDVFDLSSKDSMVELKVKEEWIGKSIRELDFRNRYHLNIVAFRRDGKLDSFPDPDDVLQRDDIIITVGKNEDLSRI